MLLILPRSAAYVSVLMMLLCTLPQRPCTRVVRLYEYLPTTFFLESEKKVGLA